MRVTKISRILPLVLWVLLFSVSCQPFAFSQPMEKVSSKNKKAIKYYKKALECYDNMDIHGVRDLKGAEENLLKAQSKDPKFVETYFILALVYDDGKQPLKAIANLKKLIEIDNTFFPDAMYFLAKLEFRQGLYEDAFTHYNTYAGTKGLGPEMTASLELALQSCEFAMKAVKNPVKFEPKNLGPGVNTHMGEYFPCITGDDQTLLFTRQVEDNSVYDNLQEDFFVSKKADGEWTKGISISKRINTKFNEGAPSLSSDGQVLIFTACELAGEYGEGRDGVGSCDLFITYKVGDEWDFPSNMGEPINTGVWESQPSYSADGKTIYFVRQVKSDNPNQKNSDIFYTELNPRGYWEKPKKLSNLINTPGLESSVLIHPDGQTLYFSSNGHPGMGGLDIYVTRKDANGNWGKPVNLGYPINTNNDENSLLVSTDGKEAFFASDRPGGYGGLDLYSFEMPEEMKPVKTTYFKGVVYDAKTKEKLEARFELVNLNTGEIVITSYSNPGNGEFLVPLAANIDYGLSVNKTDYKFYSKNFSLIESEDKTKPFLLDVPLTPIASEDTIRLDNVFFDLSSYTLRKESYPELDKLADLLKKYPDYNAEIMGHTDTRGVKKDNQTLSENRAKSVMDYLISKEIDKKRLSSKGFGDSQPKIKNAQTEEEHQENRRTEYRLYK